MIARALRSARAQLAELGVRATADQLYYATSRMLLPPPHRGRPGYLLPRPVPRRIFDRVLARAPEPAPVAERLPVLAAASDAPDLLDYGLPRVLVCQNAGIAAMLLANDLHMESATVVLGGAQVEDGLPVLLKAALDATTVYLLHDATGVGMAWRAGIEERIDASGRTVALGLRPAQARALHLVRGPSGGAELAAVPPAHLLRALRRLLSGSRAVRPATAVRERARLGFLSWPGERA